MKVLILDTCYPAFLAWFYGANPGLEARPFAEQHAALMATAFGTADFYSRGLRLAGHEAEEIVVNAEPLQRRWAVENGLKSGLRSRLSGDWTREVVARQIELARPDVLYVQDVIATDPGLLRAARPWVRLVAGQASYSVHPAVDLGPYDVIFTSFPHYVDLLPRQGVPTELLRLAFEPSVLERAASSKAALEPRGAVFVGSLGSVHEGSTRLLEAVAAQVPIDFWGPGVDSTARDSPIRARHHGEAWGLDMFRVFAAARIVLNRHVPHIQGRFANNMRLYEATGMGALLVTDAKDNLAELFIPGQEVIAYHDAADCAALVRHYLDHEPERAAIARAGQQRTLRDHTYAVRMRELAALLERHLRGPRPNTFRPRGDMRPRMRRWLEPLRPVLRHLPGRAAIKRLAGLDRVRAPEAMGECSPAAPRRRPDVAGPEPAAIQTHERELVEEEVANLYRGYPAATFRAAAEAMREAGGGRGSILEVGCGSGLYSEVLSHLLGRTVDYRGVESSERLLRWARERYPRIPFARGDAHRLPLRDCSVDVVLSEGVPYLRDPQTAIAESVRVARRACIFHRTPLAAVPGVSFTAVVRGVATPGRAFSRRDFEELLARYQLEVVKEVRVGDGRLPGVAPVVSFVTFACRVRGRP